VRRLGALTNCGKERELTAVDDDLTTCGTYSLRASTSTSRREARRPRPILVRLSDQAFIEDLRAHFRRSGFTAVSVGGVMVEIGRPDAPTPEQERNEIGLHARVWEAMHPDARLELL
jgi:hypothetical protein